MSHIEQQLFVKLVRECFPEYYFKVRVIEIGSYDVNGSIRQLFTSPIEFTGVDLVAGPGVDVVCGGNEFNGASNSYDVAISCECFEHNPFWLETFCNMIRMVKPCGMVLFTCASRGRLEHGTKRTSSKASPGTQSIGLDYYSNLTTAQFKARIDFSLHFHAFRFFIVPSTHDLFFVGFKHSRLGETSLDDSVLRGLQRLGGHVADIRRMRWEARNALINGMVYAIEGPMTLASYVLPDRLYQHAALRYFKVYKKIKKYLLKSTDT